MTRPPLRDEVTRELLPAPLAWLLPRPGGRLARAAPGAVVQSALRLASAGLVDQIALRTAAIDAAIDEARARGVAQLVLVGAGLDARAHRLSSLVGARVFEVDHPASQRIKRRAIERLRPPLPFITGEGAPVYVAVDLVRDDLAASLGRAGHDAAAPTCWVAEGLTMYLPREVTRSLLATIGERSAPGSVVAMTYMRTAPEVLPDPLLRLASAAVGLVGEPLRGSFEPPELASLLASAGLAVVDDTNSRDWAERFDGSPLGPALFRGERLVVARTPPLPPLRCAKGGKRGERWCVTCTRSRPPRSRPPRSRRYLLFPPFAQRRRG